MLFATTGMSSISRAERAARQLAGHLGLLIAEARRARHWTLRDLASRAGLAISSLHAIEHGRPASLVTYAAIAAALNLELRLDLQDPRAGRTSARGADAVHAVMGELIAARLSNRGFGVAIDEPFQHYQFAGRGDVVAWDPGRRALIHVENRTRFPNLQEAIGSYNAKRRYLASVLATRLEMRGGFASETHVLVGLWSAELLHSVRLRSATFRATCPDTPDGFEGWLRGLPPNAGETSEFVLMDPAATGRQRMFLGLEDALHHSLRPRHRGYAEAAAALTTAGLL